MKKTLLLALLLFPAALSLSAQSSGGTSIWNSLSAPSMDPSKTAITENVDIVRDRVHITLVNGTIQFVKPVNGIVFGAVFHGEGRVQADPPNPTEAHQLQLFTKQDKLSMSFTDATFSFTYGLLDEVAKQVKWKDGGATDDLYTKRQQEREDLGAEYLPKLFKSLLSPTRNARPIFLPI